MSKHAGSYANSHFYQTFQSTPSRGKCDLPNFFTSGRWQREVREGGRNGCYRKPSIGAKAIKSCGPHHQKTEAFFPGSRLYAVILKRRKSDMKSLRHVGLHENFVIGAIGADSGFMKLSSMSFFVVVFFVLEIPL